MQLFEGFFAVHCYADFVAAFAELVGENFLVDEVVFDDSGVLLVW